MSALAELAFRHPFRRYQRMILDVIQGPVGDDRKYHIVAPPGAGKTIVGLELIRRFGQPAVVFAPTSTIQKQWQEKIAMFVADPDWIGAHSSLNPRRLAEINVLTYQVLSTPGENLAFVERIALDQWADDLLASGRATTEEQARQRIATLKEANPKAYRREVSRRYGRVKREFLQEGTLDGRQFLHKNARELIDRIVALGTGTVVLDECHHLLDYWAFILRELIRSLPDVHVVGLTATLPDPANQTEYENYTSLLGPVDFEVPTPAVVKEGNLAPYRDLVYFCRPTAQEQSYLEEIQRHFEAAVWQATNTTPFRDWLWRTLFPGLEGPENPSGVLESFETAFKREPLLCISAVRYLFEQGVPLPLGLPIIEEMLEPLKMDDWLNLMENYALRALKVSPEAEHQALYQDLCDALLPFGITISERGIRHQRSPGDLVLALSESKGQAVVDILRAESRAMDDKLRAVVIADYERMSARTRRLTGILDPDAGSAVRVFRHLVAHPATELLAPILVTGRVVLVSTRSRPLLEGGIRRWVEQHQAALTWEWATTKNDQILRLEGSGPDWSSRTYVALITALFEQGISRCLVGTRGIFGEGWDALRLNTLVDLTSVTASTGVQQIRGRPIRLDPSWHRKVAHNWDVVCVSREFDKGDSDLRRFVARHAHTWGAVILPVVEARTEKVKQAAVEFRAPWRIPVQSLAEEDETSLTSMRGRIVRGVAHVDLQLAVDLATREFKRVRYSAYTRRMLEAVWDRDRVYDLWGVGQPYENLIYSSARLEARDLRFRTAYTVQRALGTMIRRLGISLVLVGGGLWFVGAVLLPWTEINALSGWALGLMSLTGAAALATLVLNGRGFWRAFQHTFLNLPVDAILLDMGRALLAALRDVGAVAEELGDDCVRVVEAEDGGYEVFLVAPSPDVAASTETTTSTEAAASPEDSDTFSRAYRQMMGPLGDARYLIERDGSSLRNPVYRATWLLVRKALGLEEDLKAYHRVPDILASRRERAETLARYWHRYVGGGRLVYSRNDEGHRILLQARAQQHSPIRQMAFEVWR